MAANVPVLIAIAVFYVLIFLAGLWAARATRNRKSEKASETVILGGRDIGIGLGICTMTATWVGGGALNGTAESIYNPNFGLLWTMAPVAFAISLGLNGIFFVKRMRNANYVTVLDPLQEKLGKYFGIVFFIVELSAGTMYSAAILNALGGTIEVVAGLSRIPSVLISTAVTAIYTLVGGLYSVAYTDVVQLTLMIIGLLLAIPFAITNFAVTDITETFESRWSGDMKPELIGLYIDTWIVMLLGGIPVQVVYQRVLSTDTTKNAQIMCIVGGIFSGLLTLPPLILGAVGASANWTMTDYMNGTTTPEEMGEARLILPIVLQYLTPTAVGLLGLGAVTAAVMSSLDGAFLGVASLFARNIYKTTFRPSASEREVVWLIRAGILVVAFISAVIAVSVDSVMALYMVCVDLVFVITLPQFFAVLYFDPNAYGSIAGITLSTILRLGGGDPFLRLPAPFHYAENFPFKTVAMLSGFVVTLVISFLVRYLFEKNYLPAEYDVLKGNLANGGRTRYFRQAKGENMEMVKNHENKNGREYIEGAPQ